MSPTAPSGRPPAGGRLSRLWSVTGRSTELVGAAPALPLRTVFRRFWPDARPFRWWMLLGLVVAVLIPAVEAAEIWMFKLVVDDVMVPRDLGPLWWIAAATAAIVVARGVLSFTDEYVAAWIGERFVLDLRTRVFARIQRAAPTGHDRRRVGDTLTRLTDDVDAVEQIVLSGVADAVSTAARIVVFTGILLYLDPLLALAALVGAPVFWLLAARVSRLVRRASREARRRSGALAAVGEESLSSAMLVAAHNREDAEIARFRAEGEGIRSAELVAARVRALFSPLVDLLELAVALLVIGLGTWAVAEGRISIGGVLAFITYLTQLYGPVRGIGGLLTSIYSASAAAERVIDVLDEPVAVSDAPGARTLTNVRGHVHLDGVSFGYPERPHVLRDVDLEIAPGEVVALTGANGAGKSTIAKLLVRFHDPSAGAVRIDGTDVRDVTMASLRDNVTLLLQESLLMHGTIRDNVLLGRPGASDAEVARVAATTGLDRMIDATPDGWDTVVGERGRQLSGGQRQLVAISRALLRDAPILVLDEPTTGLDADARARVAEPLRTLMRGRTTIVISHDAPTVAAADRVLRLHAGAVSVPATNPLPA